ncbi:hypothetical protein LSG31_16035 [Fodinisporobacter ferrooxydans]|uniref:Uncharacterized protein n=1 Tax=Fodinisporobacter ferrooxydans TaxID=2901836 RepID=A0ABY4CFV5_9BACL|nr:hypothetical protein LSG31_16035 [Alicyclobacillaceae bacterium MYW30-H2]
MGPGVTNHQDEQLLNICREVAKICCSSEFKKLYREMSRYYRKSGIMHAKRIAYQDALFSMVIEYQQESNHLRLNLM